MWGIEITKAHQGAHPGMSGMKRRIRSDFWFPKLSQKVEDLVSSCKECQLFTHKNMKEPLIIWQQESHQVTSCLEVATEETFHVEP